MGRKRSGFTLIELLVVIAIIAILAAILFPVFTAAKQQGQITKCLSNTRQLSSALSVYTGDNDGCWPYCWYILEDPDADLREYGFSFWMKRLVPYVKDRKIFGCPSARRRYSDFAYSPPPNPPSRIMKEFAAANYGMNEYLIHSAAGYDETTKIQKGWFREGNLRFPSKTALLADCVATLFHDWDDEGPKAGPDGVSLTSGLLRIKYADNYAPLTFNKGVARHKSSQVVFADGHAQAIRLEQFAKKEEDGKLKEFPIIHPEAFPVK